MSEVEEKDFCRNEAASAGVYSEAKLLQHRYTQNSWVTCLAKYHTRPYRLASNTKPRITDIPDDPPAVADEDLDSANPLDPKGIQDLFRQNRQGGTSVNNDFYCFRSWLPFCPQVQDSYLFPDNAHPPEDSRVGR